MTYRRIGLVSLAVLIALIIIAFAFIWRPELTATAEGAEPAYGKDEIARGYALAQLGNCESCHTAEDGAAYAGGRPLDTPFGTIFAVNITPDRETGIGKWSPEAFTRAMRKGVDREGAHLYPAFPYTSFTKIDDGDISALYAYLRTVPAVENEAPENALPFPFNIRALMAGWNLLFLDAGPVKAVSGESDDWNTGRYLVEGVTHCGACHTPRNALGAEKSSDSLAGAEIDGWYAPPLAGDGARSWNKPQLAAYLSAGFSRDHGAAAGPMGETVTNLSKVSPADVTAIATYVASLTDDTSPAFGAIDNGVPDDLAATHALWVGACASCHEAADGRANPSYGVPLSVGFAVRGDKPLNAARTIVGGIDAYRDRGGPYMPAFGGTLTAEQITDLTQYVRARFSDGAAWEGVGDTVEQALSEQNEGNGQ